ncbi:hypothetical protein SGRIM119S_01667 [Streptomyces griseorubiginosus]
MNEPSKRHEAIDISGFVYAATGARVRRLTMPDGMHWFPAVDVCNELGLLNTAKALRDHVPEKHREMLGSVSSAYGLTVPPGRRWRRDLQLIDLHGLIILVNACTKPLAAPFKQWAAEVLASVHREGSYALEEAEVQLPGIGSPVAYAMPEQVAEAIVRLEERNLQADEQLAVAQHKSIALQEDILETQRATLAAQQAIALAMERIADRLDALALKRPSHTADLSAPPTTESVLADWRQRLSGG